jgi:hypothetical protein
MSRRSLAAAAALVLCALILAPTAGVQPAGQTRKFPEASVRFEQNATDGDVEVVIDVSGRNEGLATLKIMAPDGRTVVDFHAPQAAGITGAKSSGAGMRKFTFESPEPPDVAAVKAAYPAGEYTFAGTTISGEQLASKATLSHDLPPTISFVSPKEDAEDVPTANLIIQWAPVKGAVGYVLELSDEESGATIEARLPATAKSFAVPAGFLTAGTSYQLGIGTISTAGNISFVETEFATAGGK